MRTSKRHYIGMASDTTEVGNFTRICFRDRSFFMGQELEGGWWDFGECHLQIV